MLFNLEENVDDQINEDEMSIDDLEKTDPWKFRPKQGCRYAKVLIEIETM